MLLTATYSYPKSHQGFWSFAAVLSTLVGCSSGGDAELPAQVGAAGQLVNVAGAGSDSVSGVGGAAGMSSNVEALQAGGASLGGAAAGGSAMAMAALGGAAGQGEGVAGSGATTAAGVRFVGRTVDAGQGAATFAWSGSGVVAAFEGTSVSVVLEDGGSNQFTVVLDGELLPKLSVQAGTQSYELASELSAGQHTVELYRRTEASFGPTTFRGFELGEGGSLLGLPEVTRRLEIIGDSISCGYGNEGTSPTCGFSADTENHYATYGAIAARALNAEVVTIAWSGKGIIYNYDTDTTDPLPALYDRALPGDPSSSWSFDVVPDAVVINLGTNDFSTDGDPTPELFRDEYAAFLSHLRDVYPSAYILCTVGPLLSGADLAAARAGIDAAVAQRQADGDTEVASWELNIPNDNPGCDYHPSLGTHEAMGQALATELQSRLGW